MTFSGGLGRADEDLGSVCDCSPQSRPSRQPLNKTMCMLCSHSMRDGQLGSDFPGYTMGGPLRSSGRIMLTPLAERRSFNATAHISSVCYKAP